LGQIDESVIHPGGRPYGLPFCQPKRLAMTSPVLAAPEWVVAELPPGYQTRYAEIQRLSAEIQSMDRIGRLLWQTGEALREAVVETFGALKLEVDAAEGSEPLVAKLDSKRRFLIHVSNSDGQIQKRSPELADVFRVLHESAGDGDRVVLIANADGASQPKQRGEPMAADALALLSRLGGNLVTGPAFFALWTLSMKDASRARAALDQLHAQDGGVFVPPHVA
jgi:hypothetical protein